jgi:hypothetical protein
MTVPEPSFSAPPRTIQCHGLVSGSHLTQLPYLTNYEQLFDMEYDMNTGLDHWHSC